MKKSFLLAGLVCFSGWSGTAAVSLTESTFTEIIREAKVIAAADKKTTTAQTNMVFHAPDRVRTGAASRVEMTAPDKTITRVGANTIFTFADGERSIVLEKGSILFHAPAGVGGGTIQYRGTAAAVLGTTMICAVLPNGDFKVMDLEGSVKVTLRTGAAILLKAGQMVVIPADGNSFGKTDTFDIGKLIARLVLVVGFYEPLPSLPLVDKAIEEQAKQVGDGTIKFFVPVDEAIFGLDIIYHIDRLPQLPPQTPDFTTVPVSPVK